MPVFGTQMFGSGAPAETAIAYSFTDSQGIQGNNTIFTFSSKSFGAADDSRVIVVSGGCAFSNVTGTVSSATIGGIGATIIVQKTDTFAPNDKQCSFIVAAAVPSGTTGDVVITLSRSLNSSNRGMGIGVHRLTGPGVVAANDTASAQVNTCASTTMVVSCDTKEDGAAVGSSAGNGGVYGSETWTGLTEGGRDYEGAAVWSSAGIATTSDESPRTMSVATGSYCTQTAVGASWHPA